ncbi:protein Spindly [Exaiptasia diaphana]|uniref:Protein Spindly n=1 Tax=Exaiptasia diaphana TaxID=2652724 RepID=A0A913XPR3_EXADI|nr:protein Spindly [Exaiptasia diaphana]KXJ09909.1 Protein Spindly [Exaiptasia diaphana]
MDKDQEEMLREFFQLKEENRLLNEEKESLYRDRELAGELGKTLLQQNKELETKLEELSIEHHDIVMKLEEMKQENYSLKSKLETQARSKDHHLYEIENIQKEYEQTKMMDQLTNDKKLKELKKEITSLQSEIEKHLLIESQYKEKLEQQEQILENARQINKELQLAANLETDLEEQKQLTTELQTERDCLLMEVTQLKNMHEQLAFDKKAVEEKFQSIEEEMQERNRQSQLWYNCLQEARQEAGEFKAELDMLKAEIANSNFKNKGNSLFGEVEDKRMELEKKYLSMKTQYDCLVKTHTVTKQHLHKLKNQVAALLQVKGNSADVSQMQRLQQACARKEGELKMLVEKVRALEKQQAENCFTSRLKDFHDAFSDFGDKKDYINFLELMLQDEKKKIEKLQKEIETKTLLQLIESDRVRNTETQLHKAESTGEKFKAENMKLRLKIEELKMKLQQAKSSSGQESDINQGLSKSKSTSAIQKKVVVKRVNLTSNDNSNDTKSSDCVANIEKQAPVKTCNAVESKDNEENDIKENDVCPPKLIPDKKSCSSVQEKQVRFQEKSLDVEGSPEERKENTEPLRTRNEQTNDNIKTQDLKTAGGMEVIEKGQRKAAKVINVGREPKNECAQQ